MGISEWKKIKLGDIITLNYGKSLPAKKRIEGNIPVYSSAGHTGYHNESLIDENGIIVGRKGTVGSVHKVNVPFYCIDTAFYVTQKDSKVDLGYLYYLLNYLPLDKLNSDSAVPGLNRENAYSQEFEIPSCDEERKKIASILRSLDNKIELNNQINQTLEGMAQAIFKEWFVEFNFPNEDGVPYKDNGGEMEESELGEIPKGWRVEELGKVIPIADGTHDSPKKQIEGYPLVTSKHLGKNEIHFGEANLISLKDYEKVNQRSKVDQHDILISMIGTIGNLYFVQEEKVEYAIKNIGLFKSSKKVEYSKFLFEYLKTPQIKYHINTRLAGSTQQYISLGELRKIPFIIPQATTLDLFNKKIESIFSKIYLNIKENQALIKTRDTLLPKLMSGEVRV